LLSSSATASGAISIETRVLFASNVTVDGMIQLTSSASLGAQSLLLLKPKAVINGNMNADISLANGAVLYASGNAAVNLASGLLLSKDVTVQAAASSTLTIGSDVNVATSGNLVAQFIGTIAVSGDLNAAASSQLALSGTSTVVTAANVNLESTAQISIEASADASAQINASGKVNFAGSLQILLCVQANVQASAQASGDITIANYAAHAGVFGSLNVNLNAGTCSSSNNIPSKRDSNGYTVQYTNNRAYATENGSQANENSASKAAFVGMTIMMLALLA